ncbi:uncharacterized protein [Nicotiana tomentosiformis]|uniref:uncharacterized protein n=1 Tax=Nicotiana tomentosiformis TaxID=4098 RepID=UPI00388CD92B
MSSPNCLWILDSGASDHISGLKTGKMIGIGYESQGLYHMSKSQPPVSFTSATSADLLHSRLAHSSLRKLQKLIPSLSTLSSFECESCQLGKHTCTSFPKRVNNRASSIFDIVHSDVWGPSRVVSSLGCQYFVTFIDDFSRCTWVSLPNGPQGSPPPLQVYSKRASPLANTNDGTIPYLNTLVAPNDSSFSPISPAPVMPSSDVVTPPYAKLPEGKSTAGCRWIYTVKVGSDEIIDRLKARLVAKEYTQIYGLDYGDTFSLVAKIASVRLLISLAAMHRWPLHQLDIKNSFLHGELVEEVYMDQPPGFVAQGESNLVCRLKRSLYGLKQSPRAWFGRFSSVVQQFGMSRSEVDHSVFYRHNGLEKNIFCSLM